MFSGFNLSEVIFHDNDDPVSYTHLVPVGASDGGIFQNPLCGFKVGAVNNRLMHIFGYLPLAPVSVSYTHLTKRDFPGYGKSLFCARRKEPQRWSVRSSV